MTTHNDTIIAPATPTGGALAIIRVSGPDALAITGKVFHPASGRPLSERKGFSIAYGDMADGEGEVVDDVLVSVFHAPNSYTGENMAEISCHGSAYIVRRIIELFIRHGARTADAGEFTSRAFLGGKMDLSQAEAVADMISSRNKATHSMALTQMKGGYSDDLKTLRSELLRLASLLELELDFSEEEVEFADRAELSSLIERLNGRLFSLTDSFSLGNAVKEGIGVAIVGKPNAGKSTLLNTLLREDRAMVSDTEGTTRDSIEEKITVGDIEYRFIDTAGIRHSDDALEKMGIERTYRSVEKASVVLYLVDSGNETEVQEITNAISTLPLHENQKVCIVVNKCDDGKVGCDVFTGSGKDDFVHELEGNTGYRTIPISAKFGTNIEAIMDYLGSLVDSAAITRGETIISNTRHYEALSKARESLEAAATGLRSGLSGDLLAQDIRQALYWLGTITGEITTDEILGEIFSKFCIGK